MIHDLIKNNKINVSGGISICECGYDFRQSKHAVFSVISCHDICCRTTSSFTVEGGHYSCTQASLVMLEAKSKSMAREAAKEKLKDAARGIINKISMNLGSLFDRSSK